MRIIWFSPECTGYSTMTNSTVKGIENKYSRIGDFNLRQLGIHFGDEYIIENVEACTDLYNPTKINGYGFNKPINMARLFETSFPVSDKYTAVRTKDYILKDSIFERKAHSLMDCRKKDLVFLKEAPTSLTVSELRPYIPPYYIEHILDSFGRDIDEFIDCFCGAGGVSKGVKKFDSSINVVGIDMMKQSNYPYEFVHSKVNASSIEKAIFKLNK